METGSPNQTMTASEGNIFNLPIDHEVIFSNHKNVYKKRIEKRQSKLLKKIPFIINFLEEGEKIILITTGCSPTSSIEQLLTGWIFIYLKRSLLVFTNKRIFHIPTKKDYSYRNSIARILYYDCSSIKIKGRNLIFSYKNGQKEKFIYIANSEKKKIKELLSSVSFEGEPSKTQKRTHLCPRCKRDLEEGKYICANCNLEFKDRDEGRKISIIYPGGGYFYTRHPWLGISDAVVEIFLIIGVIASFIDLTNSVQESGINLFIFAILLLIEKAISVYHSNHFIKEYIPKEKEITFLP